MDDVERGEDSNSPNANSIVEIKWGADGRVRIELSNGSSFFVSSSSPICDGLSRGLEIDSSLVAELEREANLCAAMTKAIDLLARREHSSGEIRMKLTKRGYEREAVDTVIEGLESDGYVDDSRYAELWVANRLRKHPEGRSLLSAGLRRKGINREVIGLVLDELITDDIVETSLHNAAEKFRKRGIIDDETLVKRLTARGFSYRQVLAYLQNIK